MQERHAALKKRNRVYELHQPSPPRESSAKTTRAASHPRDRARRFLNPHTHTNREVNGPLADPERCVHAYTGAAHSRPAPAGPQPVFLASARRRGTSTKRRNGLAAVSRLSRFGSRYRDGGQHPRRRTHESGIGRLTRSACV